MTEKMIVKQTKSKNLSTVLKKARNLISDTKNWTQGTLARKGTHETDDLRNASKWCAIGSIRVISGDAIIAKKAVEELNEAARSLGHNGILSVNDSSSRSKAHPVVMEVFDEAIKR